MNGRSNIEAIYSNVFGDLMLHRILSDTNTIGTITMHMCKRGETNTNNQLEATVAMSPQLSYNNLLLGLPANQEEIKEDIIRRERLEV
jgi:hypothetical protein